MEGKETDRERNIAVRETVDSHMPSKGDLTCNPGMCPDWESNWRPYSWQASAQSTEPHQPGQYNIILVSSVQYSD